MTKAQAPWRNRIVGYSEEVPDQLLANPSNWRIHPASQQNALSGVLKEIGLVQNVIANRTTGNIVDGHLRIALAMREGQPTVPVTWVELTEDEELYVLATIDPVSAMATADAGALDALLSSVQSGEAGVQAMLAREAAKAGLYLTDPAEEWQGMPEFEQEGSETYQDVVVHFMTAEDVELFAELVDQTITKQTKYIYYPKKERQQLRDLRVKYEP